MLKITILDEQEPSVQSADRTKAVQVWSWGNMYLSKPGKWPSQHASISENKYSVPCKESQATISQNSHVCSVMLHSAKSACVYVYDHVAQIIHLTDHPMHEKCLILGKSQPYLGVTHISTLPTVSSNWRKWVDGSLTLRFDSWNIKLF